MMKGLGIIVLVIPKIQLMIELSLILVIPLILDILWL